MVAMNVGDIVTLNPAASRVFEQHGIDYCCHGRRGLEEACADAGVDVERVRAELAALAQERSPVPDDLGGLIGHIVSTHHRYLRRELPRLASLMGKVVAAHGQRHPEVHGIAAVLDELTADLMPHLLKEERVLFPAAIELLGAVSVPQLPFGTVQNPLRVMHAEHDRVGELLATLRARTDTYQVPGDACPTWRALYAGLAELEADIHVHVHLENNVLFPRIVELERLVTS